MAGETGFITQSELDGKIRNLENGYDQDGRKKKKKLNVSDQVELGYVTKCLPGELAIALDATFKALGIEAEETNTIIKGPFGELSIPFARATVVGKGGEKFSVGWGSYDVEHLGKLQLSTANSDMNGSLSCFPNRFVPRLKLWDDILNQLAIEIPKVRLFRGQAFKITRPKDLILPNYLDLSAEVKLILNKEVEDQLDVSLWRVIKHWKALEGKVRRKRGIVMSGHYGSGKTITALATAQLTIANGLTFFTTTSDMAMMACDCARVVMPCVVFLEDLDQATHGDRDDLNDFLNTLSGIESKNTDMILLVSTNFVDRINPAFLRPERLDTIVEFTLPVKETIGRIIRTYSGDSLRKETDIDEVCKYLVGATPAIVAEAVTLAKIKAITDGTDIDPVDLMKFARGLDKQRKLASPSFVEDTLATKLEKSVGSVVFKAIKGNGY